jgi:hypothetical protein
MTNGTFPSGWYRDPTGQGDARYWNGAAWTDSVSRGGITVSVPIGADQAQLPPAPGSEVQVVVPAATTTETTSSRSPLAVIFGILAVVLLVVVIVLLVTDDDSDDPNPPITGVTTPATATPDTTG